jgi:hypothetical protein
MSRPVAANARATAAVKNTRGIRPAGELSSGVRSSNRGGTLLIAGRRRAQALDQRRLVACLTGTMVLALIVAVAGWRCAGSAQPETDRASLDAVVDSQPASREEPAVADQGNASKSGDENPSVDVGPTAQSLIGSMRSDAAIEKNRAVPQRDRATEAAAMPNHPISDSTNRPRTEQGVTERPVLGPNGPAPDQPWIVGGRVLSAKARPLSVSVTMELKKAIPAEALHGWEAWLGIGNPTALGTIGRLRGNKPASERRGVLSFGNLRNGWEIRSATLRSGSTETQLIGEATFSDRKLLQPVAPVSFLLIDPDGRTSNQINLLVDFETGVVIDNVRMRTPEGESSGAAPPNSRPAQIEPASFATPEPVAPRTPATPPAATDTIGGTGGDRPRQLLGKWQAADNPRHTVEFTDDGLMLAHDDSHHWGGRFAISSDRTLEVPDPRGQFLGTVRVTWAVVGNTLTIAYPSGSVFKFKRPASRRS